MKKNEWTERLRELSALKPGWNSYGASPPNSESILIAKLILEQLSMCGGEPSIVMASAQDGVVIVVGDRTRYTEVEVYNTGEVVVTQKREGSDLLITEIDKSCLPWVIDKLMEFNKEMDEKIEAAYLASKLPSSVNINKLNDLCVLVKERLLKKSQ